MRRKIQVADSKCRKGARREYDWSYEQDEAREGQSRSEMLLAGMYHFFKERTIAQVRKEEIAGTKGKRQDTDVGVGDCLSHSGSFEGYRR